MVIVESILHPSDFSPNSTEALRYARALSELFGAKLHIVNIAESSPSALTMEMGKPKDHEEGLKLVADGMMARHLEEHGIDLSQVVAVALTGDPHEEIVAYAKRHNIGMIVMGTHGRRKITQILMGSVAERVVRKAPCPVLTVPEG
ncbi:MAG: universal stress protein [Myxococcales bacterium]|nr:universal stress protein [Myxococcales bacterium]MCB9700596.1 universal stress protein [Myxococcales bacterium]